MCQRLHKLKGYFVQNFIYRVSFSVRDSSSVVVCKGCRVGGIPEKLSTEQWLLVAPAQPHQLSGSCFPGWHVTAQLNRLSFGSEHDSALQPETAFLSLKLAPHLGWLL